MQISLSTHTVKYLFVNGKFLEANKKSKTTVPEFMCRKGALSEPCLVGIDNL